MANMYIHADSTAEGDPAKFKVELSPTHKGVHFLTIRADKMKVNYFIDKAQLLSLMNALIDYTATGCDTCGEWGADQYDHEGRSYAICKDCETEQPTINDLNKMVAEAISLA